MERTLLELEDVLREHAPAAFANLAPPATDAELARLSAAIAPYEAPPELIRLYRWHNGQLKLHAESLSLSLDFLPIRNAIADYEGMQTLDGIKPWFPVFGADGHFSIVALDQIARSSPVYSYPKDGTDLVLEYVNLESLLRVAARAHEAALLGPKWAWGRDPKFEVIQRELNVEALGGELKARSPFRYSKYLSHVWPMAWKSAIGRDAAYYEYRGPMATIAELVEMVPGQIATVHIHLGRLSGRGPVFVHDDTGEVEVIFHKDTRRELQNRLAFELDLLVRPLGEQPRFEVRRVLRISEGAY